MTLRNKLFGGVLCTLIVGQLVFGTYAVTRVAMGPGEFLNSLLVRWRYSSTSSAAIARCRLRSVQGLPSTTVAIWGTVLYQSGDRFRYALADSA